MLECYSRIQGNVAFKSPDYNKRAVVSYPVPINLVIVSCDDQSRALILLKSATLFSQDAALHLVIFGDDESIEELVKEILCLKWTVNALGWDFTYELHMAQFPTSNATEFKEMFLPCSTQRLFLPSLLPHLDAALYLDADTVVLSNLTEIWSHFTKSMGDSEKVAAIAANSESALGIYNVNNHIPFYGTRGLNAGVIMMNLTRMRAFKFEEKALAAYTKYRNQIQMADQDMINIVFHDYPEKLHQLPCNYNFCGVHCQYKEYRGSVPGSYRFCNATLEDGIRILHGNDETFEDENFPAFMDFYSRFENFDLLRDSPQQLFKTLSTRFKTLPQLCPPLSAEMMYGNAQRYFQ